MNISEYDYILRKTWVVKLERIKLPLQMNAKIDKKCEENKRVTRTAKKASVRTEWVRILDGLYKNDIAHVEHWDLQTKELKLKIIPRIANGPFKRRPCAKRFDPELTKYVHFLFFLSNYFHSFQKL